MTAIESAIQSGAYREYRSCLPNIRGVARRGESCPTASKRFLVRIIARAILDYCTLKPSNPHYESAKRWLTGGESDLFVIPFDDLCLSLDMEWIKTGVESLMADGVQDLSHVGRIRRLLSSSGD